MVKKRNLLLSCLVLVAILVGGKLAVGQVKATVAQDTYIRHARMDENYGFQDVMLSGNSTIESNWRTDALVQFDLPPAPEGQVATNATLELFNGRLEWANRGNADYGAMAIMFEWLEDEDTWFTLDADFADYGETVYDVVTLEGVDPPHGDREDLFPEEWVSWDITELVNAWYDGSIVNNGVAINGMANYGGGGDELFPQFHTKDSADEDLFPMLTITFGDGDPLAPLDDGTLTDPQERADYVHNVLNTWIGDSNLDGEFNSSDFVVVFSAGEYEDGVAGNSKWATGDWNGDKEFDTSDFVTAFSDGGYEKGPRTPAAVPEPIGIGGLVACIVLMAFRRRRTQAPGQY